MTGLAGREEAEKACRDTDVFFIRLGKRAMFPDSR
jgi:hypothetical protein